MRLYYDLDDRDPITKELCDLQCKNSILDICNARRLPGTPELDASRIFPMNWRFFPTLDPQVSYYLHENNISALEWHGSKSYINSLRLISLRVATWTVGLVQEKLLQ